MKHLPILLMLVLLGCGEPEKASHCGEILCADFGDMAGCGVHCSDGKMYGWEVKIKPDGERRKE